MKTRIYKEKRIKKRAPVKRDVYIEKKSCRTERREERREEKR